MICNQPENVPLATEQSVISSSEAIEYLFLKIFSGLHIVTGSLNGPIHPQLGLAETAPWARCSVGTSAESHWWWQQ